MSSEITVQEVAWDEARDALEAIRSQVFVQEQGVPQTIEWDGRDGQCRHVLARSGEQAIGCARMLPDGKIGRMAVLREWRGQGVGRKLLDCLLKVGAEQALPRIYLHAQQHAAPFYREAGFEPVGATFEEAGIPHICMQRSFPDGHSDH